MSSTRLVDRPIAGRSPFRISEEARQRAARIVAEHRRDPGSVFGPRERCSACNTDWNGHGCSIRLTALQQGTRPVEVGAVSITWRTTVESPVVDLDATQVFEISDLVGQRRPLPYPREAVGI